MAVLLADVANDVGPVGVPLRPAAGVLLEFVESVRDHLRIAGEVPLDLDRPVVAQQHDAVVPRDVLAQELAHVPEHPIAVLGPDVHVIDVDHQVEAFVLRHDDPSTLQARPIHETDFGFLRHQAGNVAYLDPILDLVEVRDRDRVLLLSENEVLPGQTGHGIAVLVPDEDLDVDDLDVD